MEIHKYRQMNNNNCIKDNNKDTTDNKCVCNKLNEQCSMYKTVTINCN